MINSETDRYRIQPGNLVLDPDGYYAIVTARNGNELTLALSNGLSVMESVERVQTLGLKPGESSCSLASFGEILRPIIMQRGDDD